MSKRVTAITSITPTATADAATELADATFPFMLRGGSSTQRAVISEIYMGGLAAVLSPTYMVLARSSTVGTGTSTLGSGQTDAPIDPSTAALAAPSLVGNTCGTAQPQRSTTLKLHNLSFNCFGGIVRWVPPPGFEPGIIGNIADYGEITLSAFTGGTPGLMGAHMVYETM